MAQYNLIWNLECCFLLFYKSQKAQITAYCSSIATNVSYQNKLRFSYLQVNLQKKKLTD